MLKNDKEQLTHQLNLLKNEREYLNQKIKFIRVFGFFGLLLFKVLPRLYRLNSAAWNKISPSNAWQLNHIVGALEIPSLNEVTSQKFITVSGWVFSSTNPVFKVFATINGGLEEEISFGNLRPDVFDAYPHQGSALKSGFSGIVSFESSRSKKINIKIWVVKDNNEKTLLISRKIQYQKSRSTSPNLPSLYKFIIAFSEKAYIAYKSGRLPMSPSLWWSKLRLHYKLAFGYKLDERKFQINHLNNLNLNPYEQWIQTNKITPKLESILYAKAKRLEYEYGVLISIIVPVFNTPQQFLVELIDSFVNQYYKNWELVLVDDASTITHVREILEAQGKRDTRIKVILRNENGHISAATNEGILAAGGAFIGLVDHDDLLPEDALLHIAECIANHPDVDWIYTDEDKIDADGRRYDPQFKGSWSPEMAITHNYTHHFTIIRTETIKRVGLLRGEFNGAQDLDLFLRVAEVTTYEKIQHIPKICYHWRSHEASTASKGTQKEYIFDSANKAIKEALNRRGLSAEPFLPPLALKNGMCLNQLKWKVDLVVGNEVTIVIPTKDRIDLLEACISSLFRTVNHQYVNILIVDDRSTCPKTLNYLQELEKRKSIKCMVFRPQRGDGTFNYARLINEAVEHVKTPYFLQLNNDVQAIESGWLEDMIGWMSIKGVGVVGARLLYPDEAIQHAGIVIGPYGGLADHQFHQLPDKNVGYLALPHAARNVSAVTGACLLTKTEFFRDIGGFDEDNFGVEYNDVDFCLRMNKLGARIVYTPQATLKHLTSASRGLTYNPSEHINFLKKYKFFKDEFYSQNISIDSMWMQVNGENFVYADQIQGMKVLLFTHELSLTGAPIVAYEFARYLSEVMGYSVSVISLREGPVHQMYDEIQIPVRVINSISNIHLMSAKEINSSMDEIKKVIKSEGGYDLVICNTLTTFWAITLAHQMNIPSIWHIHESVKFGKYSSTFIDSTVGELIENAFQKANRIVFQANATRAMFGEFEPLKNFFTIPGGMPLERIENFRNLNSKASLRMKYGIPEDAYVVVLVGTTCERKGQSIFLDAINLMDFSDLPENLIFLMVGAIEGQYLNMLREKISKLGLKKAQLVNETKEIYDYYALSNLFVCASFEESFPMVILLAMAFELPIVSTDVFGIPEIISNIQDGLLVDPGNPKALGKTMMSAIQSEAEMKAMASRAYAKVYRLFDSEKLNLRYSNLTRKVMSEEIRT